MSVLSSPSPTLSPKPAFSHDRSSFASLRRSSSHRSYRLSPSSSQVFHSHVSSPATSIHTTTTQHTPTSAPKRRAVDDGQSFQRATSVDASTQYTPPDYPPTASQSISSTPSVQQPTIATTSTKGAENELEIKDATGRTGSPSPTPPEPTLRRDPQPQTPTGISSNSTSVRNASDTHSDVMAPVKRARGESSAKAMPLEYMQCDVRDLGIVIADMLMELIRINDPLPVRNEQLTRYHSRYVSHYFISQNHVLMTPQEHHLAYRYTTTSIV
jgi:hypothetical protein